MKLKLTLLGAALALTSVARADFNPVTLTANSYTFDIVVESNTVQALPYCINVTAGNGTGLGDNTYYEQGLYARTGQPGGNSGVPKHNTVFTNILNPNMAFIMPSDYSTNNDLMIDSTFTSGGFNFNSPTTATNLAILGCGGGGATTVGYTVTHADTTTESGSLSYPDWFNGGSTVAWGANGRITSGGTYNNYNGSTNNNNAPYLYANQITVSGASPVVSISFTYSSGQHANIFAVSGNETGSWTPIPLGGFNVLGLVPAAFPLTATMDQGTNTANNGNLATWFEQGFIRGTPTVGLPPSGSTFNSQAQPTHHYQMGNYSANNGILIDHNHLAANITPASPANYTAFSFLTAGGNVGGNNVMTNICILQHQDGVNETNLFFGYDWFNGNVAPAFVANGRVNMYSRTVNNVNNGYPKLFESYFVLTDLTSPVTNILVRYGTAPGGNSTTFVMAISASTNPVPPLVNSGPVPAVQSWYPGQTATFTVQVNGSQPITNAWLQQQNGVYVPLTDGVDANGSVVSGSSSTVLTVSGLTLADATNYEYIAANSVGSVTSAPAMVEIKGRAGVVTNPQWNNIDNLNYPLGNPTTIYSSDSSSATLTLSDYGSTNSYNSGLTGDGANLSLMHGYIDAGQLNGTDAVVTVSGLTGSSYNVYIYCFPDQTRPSATNQGLPNYSVNGTIYYAPALGATGASTYTATGASVGGTGFHGFVQATTFATNDFNKDLSTASFGNYIEVPNVVPVGGVITVQAEADTNTYRSPLNGIQLVSTSDSQDFGIHFLGNTTDFINGPAVVPVIDSQVPSISPVNVLTNHTTLFSVSIDASNAPPFAYQWYNGSIPIPGATNSSYAVVATNPATFSCVITNIVGAVTSTPVALNVFLRPALSSYQAAIFSYNPVAYWPLTETDGTTAFDYAGTNDGVYTGACSLGAVGLPPTAGIGANTSVGFDGSTAYVEVPVGNLNITNALTMIQWVQPPLGGDTGFATTLGHGDTGYRLSVVGGQPHFADAGPDVVSPTAVNDGNWHQLVGVYDGTNQYLYVDGQLAASPLPGSPPGNTGDVRIGGAPDYGNRMFNGSLAQCAILPTALTAAQVLALYNSLDTPPTVSITPASPSVFAGSSITLTAHLSGTTATELQWYSIDTLNNSNNIAGATNAAYTINNTPLSFNGYTFGIIAANAYGTNTASAVLSVQTGPAYLGGDISPLTGEAYVGAPVTYSVNAQGSLPIFYQWFLDGTPVSGATNASYTLPTPCGIHAIQVTFTNAQNGGSPVVSSTASLQGDAYPTNITFNTNGIGWQLNSGAVGVPTLANNVLELTDNGSGESSSAFYMIPQYVGSFAASFTYQGIGSADGAAFIVQNGSSGVTALGGGGGGLGYYGISNSIALEINLYNIPGIAPGTNGNTFGAGGGAAYQPAGPVDVSSGHPINISLNWANGVLGVSLMDATTLATYSTNYPFGSLTPILGGTDLAYVGFSGGTGGSTSIQTISNFEFHSVIPPVALSVSPVTTNSFLISWPAGDPSYVLQQASSLTAPTWVAGPPSVVVGSMNQATVTATGGSGAFYRLVRVVCQ
jgi:hypothetical protein